MGGERGEGEGEISCVMERGGGSGIVSVCV